MDTSLSVEIQKSKLPAAEAESIKSIFVPFFEAAEAKKKEVETIVVTSLDDKAIMQKARSMRIELQKIRTSAEKQKNEIKEPFLRKTQLIDALYRYIVSEIKPMEEHLDKQEKFIQIEEEKVRDALIESRTNELSQYNVDVSFFNLGDMPEEQYLQLVDTSKAQFQLAKEKAEAEEKARIERERAEEEERQRIFEENERLRAEAAEAKRIADAELAAERKRQEEKLATERAERARVEAELQAQREAERKRQEAEEAERQAQAAEAERLALASDSEKLLALSKAISAIQFPEVKSKKAKVSIESVSRLFSQALSVLAS